MQRILRGTFEPTNGRGRVRKRWTWLAAALWVGTTIGALASDRDTFLVKREAVFEFARKPAVTRQGDRVTVSFESKGCCDVTVAVENATGRIVRHLASGVLGPNAPAPLVKNAKAQTLEWDGKDDAGKYVDDKQGLSVRVSLGLDPQFEKVLYYHPKKLMGYYKPPYFAADKDGVYVYEGAGIERVQRFDHEGRYQRTVYPFPAGKLSGVQAPWKTYPDGYKALERENAGMWMQSFLAGYQRAGDAMVPADVFWGGSAASLALGAGRLAVCDQFVARLATDGSTGGLDLLGPRVAVVHNIAGIGGNSLPETARMRPDPPGAAAFSPDGKVLYLAGYHKYYGGADAYGLKCFHAIYRMDFEKNEPIQKFLGEDLKFGADEQHFNSPLGIACDTQGRVYVADHYNDRVQVFTPEGKFLKTIPVPSPAQISVHHRTGELYVFSWRHLSDQMAPRAALARLYKFGPLENPARLAEYPLPLNRHGEAPKYEAQSSNWGYPGGLSYRAILDSWTEPPTIWLAPGVSPKNDRSVEETGLLASGIRLLQEKDGKLVELHDLTKECVAETKAWGLRMNPCPFSRQRLFLDNRNGMLYAGEQTNGLSKVMNTLMKIDPETGKCQEIELPLGAEDLAMDNLGHAYIRCTHAVARFTIDGWREVPFDYGEEGKVRFIAGGSKEANLLGYLHAPADVTVPFHDYGFAVTPNGDVAMACFNRALFKGPEEGNALENQYSRRVNVLNAVKVYRPQLYPGRYTGLDFHVFDKHGKLKQEDAVPGVSMTTDLDIDPQGNLYLLVGSNLLLDGKEKYGDRRQTVLVKAKPKAAKFISSSDRCPVPLPEGERPAGPAQMVNIYPGQVWVQGAEWMYAGIGVAHMNAACACWNHTLRVDYFGRSFVPETDRCQVGVLDTNGNLILHVGQYGNADSAGAQSAQPLGGDEVGLMYPCYVETHTDRRLFIADQGNQRIVSVKLGYHTQETIALKNIPDSQP